MLAAGAIPVSSVPDARVWRAPGDEPVQLREAIAGPGQSLLCFYPFDWSTGCTLEMRHLHERRVELERAGIRPFAVSLDHPWSQRAWAEALGVDSVVFLSDRLGEAAASLGILTTSAGMPVAARSAFLVRGDSVRASWMLTESPLPDVDAIVAAASSP